MVLLLAAGLLAGCRDEGAEGYQRARQRYEQLISQGRPSQDPGFDEVTLLLESVSKRSRAHDPARALLQSIQRGRAPRAEAPLATSPEAGQDAPLASKRAECEALAQKLGEARPPERSRALNQVEDCRRALAVLKEHGDEAKGH